MLKIYLSFHENWHISIMIHALKARRCPTQISSFVSTVLGLVQVISQNSQTAGPTIFTIP